MESWGLVAPLLAAKRRVVRYDTRGAGLLGENPRRPDDRHHDRRPDRAARRARHHGKGRAGRHGGRRRDRAAHGVAFPDRVAAVIVTSPATSIPPANREADAGARREVRARRRARRVRGDRQQRLSGRTARRQGAVRGLPRALARERSGELRGDLSHARRHGPEPELAVDQMPGAGDRRRIRSRPPARAWSSRSRRPFRARSSRCCRPGIMRDCRRPSWSPPRSANFSIRSARDAPLSFRPRCAYAASEQESADAQLSHRADPGSPRSPHRNAFAPSAPE